ncbi:hypothetical protein [Pikeienuella sp. HZG-20]|uniref:hypothetical protein n=1 Tax=Paludibacillus litoralis TaxID=3133267 RepID=UPI0030ED44F8
MISCEGVTDCFGVLMPISFEIGFAVVALASVVAAVTPTPRDDVWVAKVYRILDALALNVGYAKEKPKSAGGRFVAR